MVGKPPGDTARRFLHAFDELDGLKHEERVKMENEAVNKVKKWINFPKSEVINADLRLLFYFYSSAESGNIKKYIHSLSV